MTHHIQWKRLVEEEKDFLDSLGIETGASFARFTRDLTWEEITLALALFASLKKRTPNPDENHVNFAVGDCLVEMERLFGKERTKAFIEEFFRRSAFRDEVLNLVGGALIYLQKVEETIKSCCAILDLRDKRGRPIRLTVADFLSNDPKRRRATLGQMKTARLNTQAFSSS